MADGDKLEEEMLDDMFDEFDIPAEIREVRIRFPFSRPSVTAEPPRPKFCLPTPPSCAHDPPFGFDCSLRLRLLPCACTTVHLLWPSVRPIRWTFAGDADAAERAVKAHMREILRSLPELIARFPELFDAVSVRPSFSTTTGLSAASVDPA